MRRVWLTIRMTLAYKGRFPKRKVWRMYWHCAATIIAYERQR